MAFKINSDTHHTNHSISKLTITPKCPEFGFEARYFIKIIKELSINYTRIINQKKIKYQTTFQQDLINKMKIIK